MIYRLLYPTGDYYPRQAWAREQGAELYIEVHLNASTDPTAIGSCCVLPASPTPESLALGRELAQAASEVTPDGELREGGLRLGGKGWANVDPARTGCPSALWEPCFVSHAPTVEWLRRGGGTAQLARRLATTIQRALPAGGVVALSVGHLGRTSYPNDHGAPVAGGGWEVDIAAEIVRLAGEILTRPVGGV